MNPQENVPIDIMHVGEGTFAVGYFFPQDSNEAPIIGIRVKDAQIYIHTGEAVGLANLILQAAHRAETLDYAMHTHLVLTHNQSDKRKQEFLNAVNSLINREVPTQTDSGSDVPQPEV